MSLRSGTAPPRTRWHGALLITSAVLLLALVLGRRALLAFSTSHVQDWDETYYASIASTALAGFGLYPYVQGYPPIPVMGGIGYAVYLYVLAFKLFGPTVLGLRLVSFGAAVAGLAGVYVVSARWYGSATGIVAAACTAASVLFGLTNSARMDALVFGWVAWLLVVLAVARDRGDPIRWQMAVGLFAALGLQVHLHTLAAASACGLLYAADTVRRARHARSLGALATGPRCRATSRGTPVAPCCSSLSASRRRRSRSFARPG